jgi:hypothetical protein
MNILMWNSGSRPIASQRSGLGGGPLSQSGRLARHGESLVPFAGLIVVFSILAILVTASPVGSTGLREGSASHVQESEGSPALASVAKPNPSYCEILDPFLGTIPADFYTNVTSMFSQLCNQTSFDDLVAEWGSMYQYVPNNESGEMWAAANFTLDWGGSHERITTVFFDTDWVEECNNASVGPANEYCSYNEVWTGNLSGNTLSGPTVQEVPLLISQGPQTNSRLPSVDILLLSATAVATAAVIGAALVVRHRSNSKTAVPPAALVVQEPAKAALESDANGTTGGPSKIKAEGAAEGSDPLDDVF